MGYKCCSHCLDEKEHRLTEDTHESNCPELDCVEGSEYVDEN